MSTPFILSKDAEIVAECFSAHYTNMFLIYLYNEARKYVEKEANVPSLTEGYKTAIAVYNNAMSRDDFVKQTLHGIWNQYLKIDATIRIRECTMKILSAFYPDDGVKGIIRQEKLIELAISKIIHDVSKQIIYTVPVNHAKSIIDKNDDKQTQKSMQDDFVQIVLEMMERNHIEYLNKKKAQYHHPSTDHVMFEKAKTELAKVTSEKSELEVKCQSLTKQLNELQSLNNDMREKVGNQQGRIRELENQLKYAKQAPVHAPVPTPVQTPVRAPMPTPVPTPVQTVQNTPLPQQPTPVYGSSLITATQTPENTKRDYSYLINNSSDSDTDSDDNHPIRTRKDEILSRIQDDDQISLDMFSK